MKAVFGILALPPVSGFIAALTLSGVVLWLGDTLTFLGGTGRMILIGVIWLLWLAFAGFWWWRRRRRAKAMAEELAPEPDYTGERISSEAADVERKFAEAMRNLATMQVKGSGGGRRYVYELPWYVFIGPPGAGKTEALRKCGIEPIRIKGAEDAFELEGGGGTRDCNWMFTNDAVFIDTAGRWSTQETDKEVDSAVWRNFIDLLKKYRPREPVNGIIVAISLAELATASPREIDERAAAMRERLAEISASMKARIPVYVLFTKADLLVGFTEFFGDLRAEERRQVWGHTFPLRDLQAGQETTEKDLSNATEEFEALTARIGEMQFLRLNEERDIADRARSFGFASQFSSMQPTIERFLRKTFSSDKFTLPLLLRGFYFTSATQTGQPIDRVIASLSQEYDIDRRVIDMHSSDAARTYFLSDLLKKVIFPEAGIVSKTARSALPVGRYATIAVCIFLPLLLGGGLWTLHAHNREQAASLQATIDEASNDLATTSVETVTFSDVIPVLPALGRLRDEWQRLEDTEPPLPVGLGVDRTERLAQAAEFAYRDAVETLIRPRLMLFYEDRLAETYGRRLTGGERGELYALLKGYLMMAAAPRSQFDAEWLREQLERKLTREYPPATYPDEIEALFGDGETTGHIPILLSAGGFDAWNPDENGVADMDHEIVAEVRSVLENLSLAERAYRNLIVSPDATAVPSWRLSEAAGSRGETALIRASGKPLGDGVPGIYTHEGFWSVFVPGAAQSTGQVLSETWVLQDVDARTPKRGEVVKDIFALYYDDYIRRWREQLDDIRIIPFSDGDSAGKVLGSIASRSNSPLRRVLEAIAEETDLARTPSIPGADFESSPLGRELSNIASDALSRRGTAGRLAEAAGRTAAGAATGGEALGQPVSDEFVGLRDYVQDEGDLRDLMAALQDFSRAALTVGNGSQGMRLLSATPEAQLLRAETSRAPQAVGGMLTEMLDLANAASSGNVRAEINRAWADTVYRVCTQTLHGRYPFGNGAPIPENDLTEILGPGGLIDSFFRAKLQRYVEPGGQRWTAAGRSLRLSEELLSFFGTALELRDALFENGARSPGFVFAVRAIEIGDGIENVRFLVGGTGAEFTSVETRPQNVRWPGQTPINGADILLGLQTGLDEAGLPQPQELQTGRADFWGLFQLMDSLNYREREGGATGRVRVSLGGVSTTLELRMGSRDNAFSLRERMRSFRCPASL